MPWYSVRQQDEHLRALNPSFRSTFLSGWMGIWEGELTPIAQTYKVRIRYLPRRFLDNFVFGHPYVTVKILDPFIAPDVRGTGERTPHIYSLGYAPELPAICAWDPKEDEWTPEQFIADTIVPWTIKWLLFYEDWLDTGVWQGRGRHPSPLPEAGDVTIAENSTSSTADLFANFGTKYGFWSSTIAIVRSKYDLHCRTMFPLFNSQA